MGNLILFKKHFTKMRSSVIALMLAFAKCQQV